MTTLIPKYDQGSTGAVNRDINLKLAETVSVLDFGADPTGVTDSTTAIQNAINYAQQSNNGKPNTVYFPSGTFKTTGSLTINKTVWLKGESPAATTIQITSASIVPVISVATSSNAILGGGISNLTVNASTNCDGIVIVATSPYGISRFTVQNIQILNCRDGINVSSNTGNVVYQSEFKNILINTITRYGLATSGISYNIFQGIEIANTGSSAQSYHFVAAFSSYICQLTCDGCSFLDCPYSIVDGFTVETISASSTTSSVCLNINNAVSVRNVFLIDIDNSKCQYAIGMGAATIRLSDVSFSNNSTTQPNYPLTLNDSGNGIIENFYLPTKITIESYSSIASLLSYKFINCPTLTNISNLGTNLVSALPTAQEKLRGNMLILKGAAGVSDHTYVCQKNAANAYTWVQIDN